MSSEPPPRISVVVPCHNTGVYLEECLASVRNQHVPGVEVIVVDDASSDPGTLDVLADVSRRWAEVRLLRVGHRNVGQARNAGLAASTAPLVLFLDSDDRIGPGFLAATMRALDEESGPGVAYTDVELFGLASGRWRTGPLVHPGEIYLDNYLQHCSLIRRSALERVGGFDARLPSYEDWELWIRLHRSGVRFVKVPGTVAHYRKRAGSKLAAHASRRAWLVTRIVLTHREAYQRLLGLRIGAREVDELEGLLTTGAGFRDDGALAAIGRTRIYRRWCRLSLAYRATRRVVPPWVAGWIQTVRGAA